MDDFGAEWASAAQRPVHGLASQKISIDGDHDEPPAKRLARSDSTPSVMSLDSESEESNESMGLGSSDSESDESGSDDDERDE